MESWHISLITSVIGVIAALVTIKVKGENQAEELKKVNDKINTCFSKYDEISKQVTENKIKLEHMPTNEQIKNEYVSREVFNQMKKHIDEKFSKLENGIDKILSKLDERKS